MLRRFVEASRRAEIVALVNSARAAPDLGETVSGELCEAFEAEVAFLVAEPGGGAPPVMLGHTGLVGEQPESLLHHSLVIGALQSGEPAHHAGKDLLGIGARRIALEPFESPSGGRAVLGVGRLYEQDFDAAEVALLHAVAQSTGHALERFWLAAEGSRRAAGQGALARAARSLNASLDREQVLQALCREVAGAMDADVVSVYFGDAVTGLVAVASYGIGAEFAGFRRAAGEGLCGQAVRTGRPQVSNAYVDEGFAPTTTAALRDVRTALSVPLHRHGAVDGALSLGFRHDRWIERADVELVEAFAEMASIACRNAEAHADARREAMIDPLTGCLNHGAFQTLLRDEIARAERGAATGSGEGLALVMVDLHDFKSVNEQFGHPAGDEVLRNVGDLLRGAMRSYDQAARYGGDEFALLLPGTSADAALTVVERSQAAIASAVRPDGSKLAASFGLVEWKPGEQAGELIDRVDSELRRGKKALRSEAGQAEVKPPSGVRAAASAARERADRRARRLAVAGRIGGRLARLLDVSAIAETAVTELQTALGADSCRLVRLHEDGYVSALASAGKLPHGEKGGWTQPQDEGAIGRCLRERRPVLRPATAQGDGDHAPAYELAVPVTSGGQLWGAVHVRAVGDDALSGEDCDFIEAVCDHLGAAMHTADLYRRLDQAYLGTAEALAAALEAKDDYTADHARSIADLAVAVGRELDLDEEQLRDIRYGAIFHDIGKIAIPDSILNKPGPLTDEERVIMETHPIAGEEILAPVPFLARVRRIVRHDHERWDGTGYPDGLRGPQIPIGARIVFVVDAYHAMVSDRPYRKAMPLEDARTELRAHAGTQFDPAVVAAFLRVLTAQGATHRAT
jgi:diguanylate cyclase (GGDEF)-like protein/putative nucleotidyltransferase with HDIG domain